MQAHGGLITRDDLKQYKAVEREPLRGTYRGYDVLTMPPPSSGGIALLEMLNILEPLRSGGSRGMTRSGPITCSSRPCAAPLRTGRSFWATRISSASRCKD